MMPEDIVRVLRIVEYIGPRSWVEKTLLGSLQGTKEVGPDKFIRTATVGTYPEILTTVAQSGENSVE